MSVNRAYLESVQSNLYDQLDLADASERPALKAALEAVGERIEEAYEEEGNLETDLAKARREGKLATKDMLKRISAAGVKAALDFALNLPPEMSPEEIERTAMGAVARGAFQHQARGTIAALPQPRAPSKEAESEWLKQARLAAEANWRAAFPHTAPQRDIRSLSAEDLAFAEAAAGLAVDVTSQRRNEDGQPKFKGDQLDADSFKRGEESARRIWPGR